MKEPIMPLVQAKRNQKVSPPIEQTEISSSLAEATVAIEEEDWNTISWADIEPVLNEEWEIGGLAMTTEAIRTLVAGE
jgi:4-oxalocrotonate tautomerase